MRPQHNNNNKRGRGRNRRHGGNMGGGGGGGGGPNNRVLDSNGPDIKLRGTAQTIAEKYMQLARDAQLSGDPVMAESYYQHGDHYYRLWLAAQPAGQPIQFSRRLAEEEMEDQADGDDGDDDSTGDGNADTGDAGDGGQPADLSNEQGDSGAPGEGQQRNNRSRESRDNRDGGNRNDANRDTGNRERFRPRWPRRNDRNGYENRDTAGNAAPMAEGQPDVVERVERPQRGEFQPPVESQAERSDEGGDWEAPSFLKRPMPVVTDSDPAEADAPVERRPRGRRPRAAVEAAPDSNPTSTED